MKFDKTKVYTALNADELKVGSKCIFADTLGSLKSKVEGKKTQNFITTLKHVHNDGSYNRFYTDDDFFCFAYLIEVPDNIESYEQWEAIYNENRPIEPYSIDSEGAAVLYEAIADYAERNLKNAFIAGQQVERLKKITEE